MYEWICLFDMITLWRSNKIYNSVKRNIILAFFRPANSSVDEKQAFLYSILIATFAIVHYLTIRIKSYFDIIFSTVYRCKCIVILIDNRQPSVGETKPNRRVWHSAMVKVFGRNQRSRCRSRAFEIKISLHNGTTNGKCSVF